ncbi:MAG: hypothetical protein GEV28_29365 [Actinophytocola sp.]|uniref:hypothetical protein n=1 Tax=Actinophytocola sp. TaxID=1872138 RepID=UPI00132222EA|nr:hypothetical protein [Actinophytocola sp.]MPZ84287.1 hypothetical protein [Actinophytocola sp.]
MNRLLMCLAALLVVAGCSSSGGSADDAARNTAPPGTVTPYASTEPPRPPKQVAKDNKAVAAAALPTSVPGYAPAPPKEASLKLCPTLVKTVPGSLVQAFNVWRGTGANAGRTLAVTVVYDPENAPADGMLATLLPPDCAAEADGTHYVYDRQPQERSDGWEGVLNTILATNTQTGAHSYETAYLMSKDDALVNVVASRANRDTFDPSVDQVAADTLETVLARFAI